jgi:hypothetical protein
MLVFQYEKCRAESIGGTAEKPDEYSYRYGRWTVVPEASSTIMDSEPMHPVCLPEIKLRMSLETIGTSGEPLVNKISSDTREAARNKALKEGSGAEEHRKPSQGKPHFHPTTKKGDKQSSSTHHEYPD